MDLNKGSDETHVNMNNAACDSLASESSVADSCWENLQHTWIELSDAAFPLDPPSLDKVKEWKSFFAKIEDNDLFSAYKLNTSYNSPEQFIAVRDLMEVWLWREPEDSEDTTLWRLLQKDTSSHSLPVDEKVFYIRDQIDSLLDYNTGINVEMSNRAALLEKLYGFYDELVLKCILSKFSERVGAALKKEQEAWLAYHNSAMTTFETINDHSGSAFPQWLFGFGAEDHILRRLSQEDILSILYAGDLPFAIDREVIPSISDEQISAAYQEFAKGFVDLSKEGLGATLKEQHAILDKERKAWDSWMMARKQASLLMPEDIKEVYDYETYKVKREKLLKMVDRKMFL